MRMHRLVNKAKIGLKGSLSAALMVMAGMACAQMSTPGQFGVSPSGAATYSIPIQVPPGVAGMQPKLSLEYNSQAGNGMLGIGWNLSGLSAITRCPKTLATDGERGGVNYNQEDRFCLDGQRLVLKAGSGAYGQANSEYRTEIDSFSKITAISAAAGNSANGPESFKVQTKAGVTMEYGTTNDSRIEAQGRAAVRVWALSRVTDAVGNAMNLSYLEELGQNYLGQISYSGGAVSLTWTTRSDTRKAYMAGSAVQTNKRLASIAVLHQGVQARSYAITYSADTNISSRIISVQECTPTSDCLPPIAFEHEERPASFVSTIQSNPLDHGYDQGRAWADFNGDGRPDFCRVIGSVNGSSNAIVCTLTTASGFGSDVSWGPLDWGLADGRAWVDFNGDGLADYCRIVNAVNHYLGQLACTLSTGTGFGDTIYSTQINYGFATGRFWVDVNGDGRADYCRRVGNYNNVDGRIQCTLSNGTSFGESIDSPVMDWGYDAGRSWVDVNGDGMADFCRVVGNYNNSSSYVTCTLMTTTGFGASITSGVIDWGYASGRAWVDFNGDGLPDYCRRVGGPNLVNSGLACTLSTGMGFGETVYAVVGDWGYDAGQAWVDINGDGMTDFCRVAGNANNVSNAIMCALSDGQGFTDQYASGVTDWGYESTRDWAFVGSSGGGSFCRAVGNTGSISMLCHEAFPRDMALRAISSGMGTTIAVTGRRLNVGSYTKDSGANLSAYPTVDLQAPILVVSSVSSSNGLGGTNTVSYQYGGLKAENTSIANLGSGRGMLGFRWMKSTEQATGIESYTEYSQSWPTIGAPFKSETRHPSASNGGLLKRTVTTYQATTGSAANTTFVYPGSVIEESWDLNGAPLPTIQTYYEYAPSAYEGNNTVQYGDPSRIVVNTRYGGADVGRKTTVNTYAAAVTTGPGTNSWVLGRLKRAAVTSENAPGSFSGFAAPPPPPSIVIPPILVVLPTSAATSYYCGSLYNFAAYASTSGGSGGYQYAWSNSNPAAVTISASGASALLSTNMWGSGGSSDVRVTVTDSGGRSAQSNILQVSASIEGCYGYGDGVGGYGY